MLHSLDPPVCRICSEMAWRDFNFSSLESWVFDRPSPQTKYKQDDFCKNPERPAQGPCGSYLPRLTSSQAILCALKAETQARSKRAGEMAQHSHPVCSKAGAASCQKCNPAGCNAPGKTELKTSRALGLEDACFSRISLHNVLQTIMTSTQEQGQ